MRNKLENNLDKKINCGNNFHQVFTSALSAKEANIISFVNPFSYDILRSRLDLITNIDEFFSDGTLLCKLHNIFCKKKVQRASFDYSSIAGYVLDYVAQNNLPIAFVGAQQKELEGALNNIKAKHNGIDITYFRNGYFDSEEEKHICANEINASVAKVVIVGMGTPYQENFAQIIKSVSDKGIVVLTCGGFLTQTSMRADYYYPFIKKLGLRWLQRIAMHQHVRQRVIKDYPKFLITYVYEHGIKALSRKNHE
jgi:N-acetylglucosaminyldiphosphoundecaprenol N-acetyl-beta-D-mannosaminyltransferase